MEGLGADPERFTAVLAPRLPATVTARVAVDRAGRIAAYAAAIVYSTPDEHRGDLDHLTDPARYSSALDGRLLVWAERWACLQLATLPRDRPAVLRLARTAVPAWAPDLYAGHGFRRTRTSITLARDLHRPLPPLALPPACTLHPWQDGTAGLVYPIYRDAYTARGDAVIWSCDRWRETLTSSPPFRPDRAFLLRRDGRPAGYIIGWDDTMMGEPARVTGRIVHLGVHPAAAGLGAGTALMAALLRTLQEQGADDALSVIDAANERSARIHSRLGFRPLSTLTIWVKATGAGAGAAVTKSAASPGRHRRESPGGRR